MTLTMPWKASSETPVNGVSSKFDEVRRALSKEAEHLAEVAAQVGRDSGIQAAKLADETSAKASKIADQTASQASGIARDPAGSASNVAQQVLKGAAELGTVLAVSSRKTAKDLSQNAQSVADDLRRVRITMEPKKTGPDFTPGISLLAGFGAGIALMYFLDPEKGKARRNMLADRLMSWTRKAGEAATGKAKHLGNRASGAMYETRKQLQGGAWPSDVDADTQTQAWETGIGTASELAATDFAASQTGYASSSGSDPSTTDTWGEQPQPSGSHIEIS
jgi:hypothetical protein